MLKRLFGGGVFGVGAVGSWFYRELVKSWFFDRVLHMIDHGVVAEFVEYGPPIVFAGIALYLIVSGLRQGLRPALPQPTIRLDEVLRQIVGIAAFPGSNTPESMDILRACDVLREKALHGVLQVFGGIDWRTSLPAHWDSLIRAPIPREYWRSHQIDVIGLLGSDGDGDHRGRTQDLAGTWGNPKDYYGIWFDRGQIDALWPPRRRITLRSPFKLLP